MRYRHYLRGRYRALLGYLGSLFMTIGGVFFLPLMVLLFYPDEFIYAGDFLIVAVPFVLLGAFMRRRFKPLADDERSITVQEGMVLVFVIWLMAVFVGSLPLMLALDLNLTQAVFESTSGWTTTGLSVVDVETAPRIVLFYRSLLQLAGGAGFVIIALAALAGPAGSGLTTAEGRSEQLAPHVRQSAGIVLRIYLSYIVVGVVALYVAGMDWFDAVNHAFTALATGGFSTRPESIGYYDSAVIEGVIIVLMILGGLNFLTAYTLLRGKFRAVWRNGEVRLEAILLLITIPLIFVFTTAPLYDDLGKQIRVAIFDTTSALTGTGFASVDQAGWNAFGWMIFVILMTIGAGSGSTAGGLKLIRVYIITKAVRWELRRAFLPKHTVNEPAIWQGESRGFLNDEMVRRVALYVFLYIGFLVAGTAITTAHGYTVGESLFEYASTLGTVGLSVGVTMPDAPASLLWAQTIGMFLGRLEFFAVFIGLTKLLLDGWTLTHPPRKQMIHSLNVRQDESESDLPEQNDQQSLRDHS